MPDILVKDIYLALWHKQEILNRFGRISRYVMYVYISNYSLVCYGDRQLFETMSGSVHVTDHSQIYADNGF